jgi:hypothetical protein
MKSVLLTLTLMLLAGPAFAQKIYIQYDPEYKTGDIKTFAWKKTEETSVAAKNPLLHSRILNGIEYYLSLGGGHEVASDPDVWVTYHTSSEEKVVLNTDHWGYGYPSRWGYYGRPYSYGGYATATTTVSTYEKGTLVVDVWDAKSDQIIWRGIAANITVVDNPVKMEKKIDKALKKMVGEWQEIKAKNAKKAAG